MYPGILTSYHDPATRFEKLLDEKCMDKVSKARKATVLLCGTMAPLPKVGWTSGGKFFLTRVENLLLKWTGMIVENCTDQKIQWTQFAVTHSDHCFSNAVWWFFEPVTVVFELLISIQSNQLQQKLISNTAPKFHPMHSDHKHHLPSRSSKPSC